MRLFRRRLFQQAVSITACFCTVVTPMVAQLAYADEFVQEADKGQNTGANFLLNYSLPTINDGPVGTPLGPNEISSQELFPGYDPSDPSAWDDLSDMKNNPTAVATGGVGAQISLGSGADVTSEAYQTLEDAADNPVHDLTDMRAEIFLDASKDIIQGDSPWIDEIVMNCEEVVIDGGDGIDTTTRLEDIYTCSQALVGAPEACTMERNFTLLARDTKVILTASTIPQSCGTGWDVDNHGFYGWTAEAGVGGADKCIDTTSPFDNDDEFVEFPGSAYSPRFCGDLDTAPPTKPNCEVTALELEHICRNAAGGASGTLNSSRGPIGSCSGPGGADYTVPVDYSLCDADRQAYCEAVYQEYLTECDPLCGATGVDSSALFPEDTDGDGRCEIRQAQPPAPDWSGYPPHSQGMVVNRYHCIGPWDPPPPNWFCAEPGDDIEQIWTQYYCGDLTGLSELELLRECSNTGFQMAQYCENLVVDPTPEPGTVEAINRIGTCSAMGESLFNACTGPPGAPGLMNGVDSIVASALPSAQTWTASGWGADVAFVEDVFDPTSYGLSPGDYVIANFTVNGTGVNAFTILDGGSYGSNWDYQVQVDLTDSDYFEVSATIYEIVDNGFNFIGCTEAELDAAMSSGCVGAMSCTDLVVPCRTVDGVQICEEPGPTDGITELLADWEDYVPGIVPMCWRADVEINDCTVAHDCFADGGCTPSCDHLTGDEQAACLAMEVCWNNASDGEEICLDSTSENWANNLGEDGWVDDCQDLLLDPNCILQPERECVAGMEGTPPDPECFLRTVFFDCGTDVVIEGVPGADDAEITCEGDFRCFGEECANKTAESNPDFVQAATAASAITEMTKDLECDFAGDPGNCKLFIGTDNRCKDPRGSYLGIIPDCCKEARDGGASVGPFAQYMQLAFLSYELANKPMVASYLSQSAVGTGISNVINAAGDPVAQAVGAVTDRISSGFSSAMQWMGFTPVEAVSSAPGVVADVAASPTAFGPLQQFIATGVNNFLESIGLEAFAEQLFTTTAEGTVTGWASSGLGEMVGQIINIIGTVYLIYSILKILGNIFFACEDEELEFGIQLVNRMCHYVGTYCSTQVSVLGIKKCVIEKQTYCCFGSPLARIMNEQLRLQGIGGDWGDAQEPNCEGISINDLSVVDWSLVDLSEWEAIMFEAGLIPSPSDPPANFIPTEIHPGAADGGTGEGVDSVSLNQETINEVMPAADEGRFILEDEDLVSTDPELMPWYDGG